LVAGYLDVQSLALPLGNDQAVTSVSLGEGEVAFAQGGGRVHFSSAQRIEAGSALRVVWH
jgi:hypothetical protein